MMITVLLDWGWVEHHAEAWDHDENRHGDGFEHHDEVVKYG